MTFTSFVSASKWQPCMVVYHRCRSVHAPKLAWLDEAAANSDLEEAVWTGPCDTWQLFFVLIGQLVTFPK